MKFAKLFFIALATFLFSSVIAGKRTSTEEYIQQYKNIAIKEMKQSGIPASITLAQGILESESGNSTLAVKANNHFGIKCHSNWNGKKVYHDDDKDDECFRKYPKAEDSYDDHTDFLVKGRRYAFLFDYKHDDYKNWAKGLKKAGYATNPKYAKDLIRVIENYQLYVYDKGGERRTPVAATTTKGNEIPEEVSIPKRPVVLKNGIKSVVIGPGDTYYKIYNEFEMMRWEIFKYNELSPDSILHPGDVLYLQPKKRKAERGFDFHVVVSGETMHKISQQYGIKLKSLYRKNRMEYGTQPIVGQKLYLRKRIPKSEVTERPATSKPVFQIEDTEPADSTVIQ